MTTLLLDTHIVLWWLADHPRLQAHVRAAVQDSDASYVSAASTWEVAIKLAIGKLHFDQHDGNFAQICADQGFSLAPVSHDDAWGITGLPQAGTDPFDRLIAATARHRGWTVVTADPAFEAFGVQLLRA